MPSRTPSKYDEKSERLNELSRRLRGRLSKQEAAQVEAFAARFYERLATQDLLEFNVDDLSGAALAAWRFAAKRKPGSAKVRVYNPRMETDGWKSSHTVIEIVNDDMPFLVDSVTGALTRRDHHIHLVIHPIVEIRREPDGSRIALAGPGRHCEEAGMLAESVMHVEIDRQSDPSVLEQLKRELEIVLSDVRAAVDDWRKMLARLGETLAGLEAVPDYFDSDEVEEAAAFLDWMRNDHFVFLGCRDYIYANRNGKGDFRIAEESGLGILRDPKRRVITSPRSAPDLAPVVEQFLKRPELLLITKTGARGTVHRPVHMDYVGIKRFDDAGKLAGERRFVGLFTSSAYSRSPREIPLLRRKVRQVLDRAGLDPMSHDGKALLHLLETYPRDELFQIDLDTLYEISMGILELQERPAIRLFARRDKFDRYFSCIVYVPREKLTTDLRVRLGEILVDAFNGRLSNFYTYVGDLPLARLHYIIGTEPRTVPKVVDFRAVEARLIAAARSWHDDFYDALVERWGEEQANRLQTRYADGFPTAYTESFSADLALTDIAHIEALDDRRDIAFNFYRAIEDPEHAVRFKIYRRGQAVPLSDCLPMMENMGLRVIGETPYRLTPDPGPDVWLHDFYLEETKGAGLDLDNLKTRFEQAFEKIWSGAVENDGFNRLVPAAGLDWRQVVVIRACCKYLRQTGITFSQAYMEATLAGNPAIAAKLVELFEARFDPAGSGIAAPAIVADIERALEAVTSLDEDRILRRFLNFVQSSLRTNYYQPATDGGPKSYLSFKLDSTQLAELPLPRPLREIFVYSPQVEAVHLRGGLVARGGLRWSDRREDFRTEVLGLMKAQMVKNAVIVPVGSKGGFVPKRLPAGGDRDAIQAEVIDCYRIFIRGMLDITDNRVGGAIVPPEHVRRYDGGDPYLVVAADKGTATFSDIANGIALEYGFWLGDAFASGGATGYDHKKLGITARGAWECVKRHFREMGRDIQTEDFTAVGIGDMSGDVFGNGMLQSRHTRLLGAFDHRHVFVDPDPDPAVSWQERRRLYELPRSSWADYDPKLISKGGGVFDRRAKSLPLSPEMRALTGLSVEQVTPNELIHRLLQAEVDLLWNGGIGTYVKAADESQAEVGDRSNDPVRVNGADLRCKVAGEGGNLGFTQRGRIEYALKGGRINTDAVDNSAGVDTSDHEVNIKILLDAIVADGEMTAKQRNRLLAEMENDVAELVLRDNYLQSQALSIMQSRGHVLLAPHVRFMRTLERRGALNRAVEFLPDEETIAERDTAGLGLTRPELAVLMAYAKTTLYGELLESDLTDSEHLANDLVKYFPRPLRKRYRAQILSHRLRGEIVATVTANSIVNRLGVSFVQDMMDETGESAGNIARAYVTAREAFRLRPLWNAIEALDNRVPADLQIEMLAATAESMRRAIYWFLKNLPQPIRIGPTLQAFEPSIRGLSEQLENLLGQHAAEALALKVASYVERGAPAELARGVAVLDPLVAGCDIAQVAAAEDRPVDEVGHAYFALGDRLGLDWVRDAAEALRSGDYWDIAAVAALVEDLFDQQRVLTALVLRRGQGVDAAAAVDNWMAAHRALVERSRSTIDEFEASGGLTGSKLALFNRLVRRMIVD